MPIKPSEAEEKYFKSLEHKKMKTAETEKEKKETEEEKARRRDLHYMCCPKCGHDLEEVAFREIMIDRCTTCRGVWLDVGELESIAKEETGLIHDLFSLFRS
jgi:hypothetical protein